MTTHRTTTIALGALIITGLALIDATFLPLMFLGPVLSGLLAGALGADARLPAAAWFWACILMLAIDYGVNQEDALFHVGIAFITAGMAAAGAVLGGRMRRRSTARRENRVAA